MCAVERTNRQAWEAFVSLVLTLQSPTPNAYTLAVSGRRPFVVVHSALLELLTPLEVQSVLGHELGNLKVGPTILLVPWPRLCSANDTKAHGTAWRSAAACHNHQSRATSPRT